MWKDPITAPTQIQEKRSQPVSPLILAEVEMVCCSPQNALTTQDGSPRIDSASPSALQLNRSAIQKYGTPEKGRVEAMREVGKPCKR